MLEMKVMRGFQLEVSSFLMEPYQTILIGNITVVLLLVTARVCCVFTCYTYKVVVLRSEIHRRREGGGVEGPSLPAD